MLGGSACTSKLHACGRCHARARSRVRSLEQLQLTGARINARALAADPRVLAFYAELGWAEGCAPLQPAVSAALKVFAKPCGKGAS